jgi:hypothetical protein
LFSTDYLAPTFIPLWKCLEIRQSFYILKYHSMCSVHIEWQPTKYKIVCSSWVHSDGWQCQCSLEHKLLKHPYFVIKNIKCCMNTFAKSIVIWLRRRELVKDDGSEIIAVKIYVEELKVSWWRQRIMKLKISKHQNTVNVMHKCWNSQDFYLKWFWNTRTEGKQYEILEGNWQIRKSKNHKENVRSQDWIRASLFSSFLFYHLHIYLHVCTLFCTSLLPSPPSCHNLFCPLLQFCWRENIRDNKKDILIFASLG